MAVFGSYPNFRFFFIIPISDLQQVKMDLLVGLPFPLVSSRITDMDFFLPSGYVVDKTGGSGIVLYLTKCKGAKLIPSVEGKV